MTNTTSYPAGFWPAQITSEMAAKGGKRYSDLASKDDFLFWAESLPEENRNTIKRLQYKPGFEPLEIYQNAPIYGLLHKAPVDMIPAPFSPSSKLGTGYGGGAFCVGANEDEIYFVEKSDGQIYVQRFGEEPVPITDHAPQHFGDLCFDYKNKQIICVRETPVCAADEVWGDGFETHELVAVNVRRWKRGKVKLLATGRDFYASPAVSPNGRKLAFLAWDLPHMPWEGAAVYELSLKFFCFWKIPKAFHVFGGPQKPCFQPTYSQDGLLLFVTDCEGAEGVSFRDRMGSFFPLMPRKDGTKAMPFDFMEYQWVAGLKAFCEVGKDDFFFKVTNNGRGSGVLLRKYKGGFSSIEMNVLGSPVAIGDNIAILGSDGKRSNGPMICNQYLVPDTNPKGERQLKACYSYEYSHEKCSPVLEDYIEAIAKRDSNHISLSFQVSGVNSETRKVFYSKRSPIQLGGEEAFDISGKFHPIIINLHGGPTAMADRDFQIKKEFWCNRGFTYLDLDYSGSSGYGAAYRKRLNGHWGQIDAQETIALAKHVRSQYASNEPPFIFLMGGSAGAYTALRTLVMDEEPLFTGALLNYPVTDLYNLTKVTHKFEAGYLYTLTGTNKDNAKKVLGKQSPLNHLDKLTLTPLFIAQGLADHVVPSSETDHFVNALKQAGGDVDYVTFEEEGHGFRRQKNIQTLLERQLAFVQTRLKQSGHHAYENLGL